MPGPLSNEALTLPMRTACVFLFDARNADHGTDMSLAPIDSNESPQKSQSIDPVGLYSARPAINLDARGIQHAAVDAQFFERARHPEAVVTRFIADHDAALIHGSLAQ